MCGPRANKSSRVDVYGRHFSINLHGIDSYQYVFGVGAAAAANDKTSYVRVRSAEMHSPIFQGGGVLIGHFEPARTTTSGGQQQQQQKKKKISQRKASARASANRKKWYDFLIYLVWRAVGDLCRNVCFIYQNRNDFDLVIYIYFEKVFIACVGFF